jgi:hypothetical protein
MRVAGVSWCCLDRQGLGGGAGLAGNDEQGRERVEVVHDGTDCDRIRRVEDAQLEPVRRAPERSLEDLGGKAAAAHPGDEDRVEAVGPEAVTEAFEGRDLIAEMGRRVEPAEALGDLRLDGRIARPERGIAIEEARGPGLAASPIGGGGPQGGFGRPELDPGRQ